MRPEGVTGSQWFRFNLYYVLDHFLGSKLSNKLFHSNKKKLQDEILNNTALKNRGKTIPMEEISHSVLEPWLEKKDEMLKTPLVFKGVAKDWPAYQKWSKHFFREVYANTKVAIIDNPGLVDSEKENEYKVTSFAEYFDEVEKDKDKYLRFSRVLDHNPQLLKDLNLNWLRKFKWGWCMGEQTFLFVGEGGTKTPMHAGLTHTIFIQIKGTKRWTICLPNERFFLHPIAARYLYFHTDADARTDAKYDVKYPMIPYVKKYEVLLEEGDVLWLPSLYWHYVENLTPTIGVAFKYTNLPQSFKITKLFTILFFMATKPTILRSFVYNKKNKQDYVFNSKSSKLH